MLIVPAEIDEASIVSPGRNVGTVEVEDRVVLVDEGAGRGHALNPTGSLVWRLLGPAAPLGDLIEDLADAFGVPRPDVADSVVGLVRDFGSLGLLDGVLRNLQSVPIDIELVDIEDCDEPGESVGRDQPGLDGRYLAAPPNA